MEKGENWKDDSKKKVVDYKPKDVRTHEIFVKHNEKFME